MNNGAPAPVSVRGGDGHAIPVRHFGVRARRRPVVMLHGLQSHSGWFLRSARGLREAGLPVYAFDRCGSGLSDAPCCAGPRLEALLAETDAVVEHALHGRPYGSVHLLAHCFGAIPALLYAAHYRPARVASLVLATPAFYTRVGVTLRDKARIVGSLVTGREVLASVTLEPTQFSDDERWVELVRRDHRARRQFPARFLYEVARARRRLPAAARELNAGVLAAFAADDPICDNRRNRRLLERVRAPKQLCEYAGARHVLDFSRQWEAFLGDATRWFSRYGGDA